MSPPTTTPELDKVEAISDRLLTISSFLAESRFVLCERRATGRFTMSGEEEQGYVPVGVRDALYEYFGIDVRSAEAERRQILDSLRMEQ